MRPSKFTSFFATVCFAALTLVSCRSDTATRSEEIVYGLAATPPGMDPHIFASPQMGIPLRSVYDTLIYREPQLGGFVPGLAESWEISEDGLVYTFSLRQDVVFHDGTSFNAEAVRVNLERILDPETASRKAKFLLGLVQRVEVLSEYQVAIVLSAPFAPLMDGLSQPYIAMASPAALAQFDNATYQFHQVGSGPYQFVEYLPGDRLIVERNPNYAWGPDVVTNPGVPNVARIAFRFFDDAAERALAMESGQVDIISDLLPSDAVRLVEEETMALTTTSIPGQPLQFMLNVRQPPTDNLAVRQALLLATDRRAIVREVFQGLSPIAHGPLSAATLGYDSQLEGLYEVTPLQAQALLNDVGLLDTDEDGWRDIEGQPVTLKIIVLSQGLIPEVAEALKEQWETTLQLQVEIRQVAEFRMLREAATTTEFNVIAFNVFGYDPVFLNGFYITGAANNWMGFSDAELDAALVEAAIQTDAVRRLDLYHQVQQRIMEQAFIIPIRDYVNLSGTATDITGLHFDTQGWFPYLTDLVVGTRF